jgi:dephospho-CoA kinase
VAEMFVKLGAHLIQSDLVARDLMQAGAETYSEVVRHFGQEILNSDGSINRSRLAEAAFGAGGNAIPRIKELNAIVHPAVIAKENEMMRELEHRNPDGMVVVEAALILESGATERFDHLIVVTCHPAQRIIRYALRHKISEEAARAEVTRRMAAQISDEKKIEAADFVIDNSGSLEATERQVHDVFSALRPPPSS